MSSQSRPSDNYYYEVPEDSGRWLRLLALLVGLAIGLAAGLFYTWQLVPVEFYNTEPVDLRPKHQDRWILLVSAAYRLDGDLERASARLAQLQDPQISQRVAELTQRYINQGQPAVRIRALALLADALGARTPDMLIYLATPEPPASPTPSATAIPSPPATASATPVPASATPTPSPDPRRSPTASPTPSRTPRPIRTPRPTSTPLPPYHLEDRQRLCRSSREQPRIEIFAQTEKGSGIPGVEIWVTWSGGAERFVTGLKPDAGLGYADFDMQMDTTYAVAIGDPTLTLIDSLMIESCLTSEGDTPLTSWRLIFVSNQPPEPSE